MKQILPVNTDSLDKSPKAPEKEDMLNVDAGTGGRGRTDGFVNV